MAASAEVRSRYDENRLLERALRFAELQALYLDTLERSAFIAAQDGWLAREILGAASLISEPATEDVLKPYSNEAHNDAVAFLVEFAKRRPAYVLAEVARARTMVLERRRTGR